MPEFVSAYQGDEGNTVVTVTKEFAESAGLTVLKQDPLDVNGRPLGPREGNRSGSAPPAKKTAASRRPTKKTSAAKKTAASTTTTEGGGAASTPEEGSAS